MANETKMEHQGLSIVGGQPSKNRGAEQVEIPVGFEMLLLRAAQDREFKRLLLTDREAAIAQSTVTLRASEQAALRAISDEALESMIRHFVAKDPKRRRFMSQVAAAAASLAAGTAATALGAGCDDTSDPTGTTGNGGTVYVGGHGGAAPAGIGPGGCAGVGGAGGFGDGGTTNTGGEAGMGGFAGIGGDGGAGGTVYVGGHGGAAPAGIGPEGGSGGQ